MLAPGGPQHRPEHLLHPGQPGRWRAASASPRFSAPSIASAMCAATGSTSRRHTGMRLLDPLRPAPGRDRGADPGEGGRLVQPELGQRDGLGDRPLLPAVRARVGAERGDGLACGVLGHLPVDPGAGRRRAAAEHRAGAAEHGERALQLRGQGVHVAAGQGGEQRLERVRRAGHRRTRSRAGPRSAGAAEPVRLGLPPSGSLSGWSSAGSGCRSSAIDVLLTSGSLFASTVRAGAGRTSGCRRGADRSERNRW